MHRLLTAAAAALVLLLAAPATALAEDQDLDLAGAAADFQRLCAPCHGERARGDGPVAPSLTVAPPDLTRIAERHGGAFPDQAVFDTIAGIDLPAAHGTRDMPVWGDVFIGEAVGAGTSLADAEAAASLAQRRIASLVAYLKWIQRAP